jgi:isopentenyldiphosphate isomerase
MYGYYVKGTPTILDDSVTDYLWVTKEEMAEYLDAETYKFVSQLLPDTVPDTSAPKLHYII